MDLRVETEQEEDGRWLAEVPELPGALAYGANREQAIAQAEALALRVIAERLEHGELEGGNPMKYKVLLHESEEGIAVSCPALPGCWSQGETEAEAVENIREAIQEYLAAVDDIVQNGWVREVEVAA